MKPKKKGVWVLVMAIDYGGDTLIDAWDEEPTLEDLKEVLDGMKPRSLERLLKGNIVTQYGCYHFELRRFRKPKR